jgi:hypothetical protein
MLGKAEREQPFFFCGGDMSTEPFDSDVPAAHRDRHQHGGGFDRPNDDELAVRTERERVEAGLEPYDSDDVPPAADATVPYDITETETYQDIEGVAARQEDEGETIPLSEDNPFPPTRYAEQ